VNRADYTEIYDLLAKTRTKYAECIKVSRRDGVVFRYTSHDKQIRIVESDGLAYWYYPADGFQLTAIEDSAGLAVSNLDLIAIIGEESITENDILAGIYSQAKVEIFLAYWGRSSILTLPLRVSWMGEISAEGVQFKAELRGIAQKLAQYFIQTTSVECRWTFTDARCGIDPLTYTHAATVTEANSRDIFTLNIPLERHGLYAWGRCTFTSGNNEGVSMEIIRNYENSIQLFLPVPYDIEVGDSVNLLQGCGKGKTECRERFNNYSRFGGEPYLSGTDYLVSYPQSFAQAPPEEPEDGEDA
jgi:uncharacterized phage protein (TIGR02218 family)